MKQLCGVYLCHYFSSDGHTLDDISIMPIEEVVLEPNDVNSLPSKRLQREGWYRQLCTVYPYGLNDSVKGVGNVSSRTDDRLVVYELFNMQKRKFWNRTAHRNRTAPRKRKKVDSRIVETEVKNRMILYKSPGFTFSFRTYFMNLPINILRVVMNVVMKLVLDGTIPIRILILLKYLMAFRLKIM